MLMKHFVLCASASADMFDVSDGVVTCSVDDMFRVLVQSGLRRVMPFLNTDEYRDKFWSRSCTQEAQGSTRRRKVTKLVRKDLPEILEAMGGATIADQYIELARIVRLVGMQTYARKKTAPYHQNPEPFSLALVEPLYLLARRHMVALLYEQGTSFADAVRHVGGNGGYCETAATGFGIQVCTPCLDLNECFCASACTYFDSMYW
jgi:hypothetical protein